MTEAEWLACADPGPMLEFLRGKISDRKLRLFACACCWRVRDLLTAAGEAGLRAAEQFADGRTPRGEQHAAWRAIGYPKEPARRYAASAARAAAAPWPLATANLAAHAIASAVNARKHHSGADTEQEHQAALLRDLMGNPFRPVALDLTWRTGEVARLAEAAYAEQSPGAGALDSSRLRILADALEEAGCADAGLLNHLRGPGPHARGCWVIDLLLGRHC
jgi:hypothetical protein